MDPQSHDAPSSEQVAAFFRKHRTGLVALVFTDLVDSTALRNQLGDQAGAQLPAAAEPAHSGGAERLHWVDIG